MPTKLAETAEKQDPQAIEFAEQKRRFEEAVAKTKAGGDTPPEVTIPEAEPEAPAEKPPRKPKKQKAVPSALEQELAELKAKVEELSQREPEDDDEDEDEAVRAELAERFGQEEADVMLKSFNKLRARDQKDLAQMRHAMDEAVKAGRANLSRTNQKRLVATHAQLKNEEAWSIVHERSLAAFQKNPKKYESIEDAYDATVVALYGEGEEEDGEAEAPEEIERAASRIAASQMTAPSKAPRRESRSKEERAKEHFEFLKKNPDDKLGAKRLAQELGLRP